MFRSEEDVDAVMSQRTHRIDGNAVCIHRSVPMERSVKDSYGIEQLVVSSLNNQLLLESDIENYFSQYGKISNISNMRNDSNVWIVDFD